MARDSRSRGRDVCSEPVAGRGQEGRLEGFKRHAEISACVDENLLKTFSSYSNEEYYRHLESSLKSSVEQARSKVAEVVGDVGKMLAVLHDIGKCTPSRQESLIKRGTAEGHELLSAAVLCVVLKRALSEVLDDKEKLAAALCPLLLAIVLHHHALRGGPVAGNLIEEVRNLKQEDLGCLRRCLMLVKDLLPRPLADKLHCETLDVKELKECVENARCLDSQSSPTYYRVAVLLTTTLMVSDSVAAKLNRELSVNVGCEELSREDDLDKLRGEFVRELLKREKVYAKYGQKLREALLGGASDG